MPIALLVAVLVGVAEPPLTVARLFRTGQEGCLPYEPDTVSLTGTLSRKTFPGRPNYESIEAGDKPETGFYLELAVPICTIASLDSLRDNNGALREVRLVQLVLDSAGYARLRPSLGHQIALRGSLFAAFTGHHHAPVLLKVTKPRSSSRSNKPMEADGRARYRGSVRLCAREVFDTFKLIARAGGSPAAHRQGR